MAFKRSSLLYPFVLSFLFCSCSTKYSYENCIETDLPLEKTWEFYSNPNAWPILDDKTEYIYCQDQEVTEGSVYFMKQKDSDILVSARVTEVTPFC